MLRKIRRTLAAICFTLITLLFLDFTGTLQHWFGWLAKIQFLPALLALNVGIIVGLVVLTLVFGRIYCSVICPLGVFQDVVAWMHKRRKRNPYSYSPAKRVLRYAMLGIMVVAFVAGIGSIVALLAPYSSYGRMANNLFQPIYEWVNNGLALIAAHYDSYAFYKRDVLVKSLPTFIIAAATFVVIVTLAWRGGRTYCNTICPVGTVLSFLARFSWLKVHFDEEKCVNCSLCSKNCKASCIDYKNHTVDYSRCVACGVCIGKCRKQALSYGHPRRKPAPVAAPTEKVDTGKRLFLVGSAIAVGSAVKAQTDKKVDGGLAVIEEKKAPKRTTHITPPGSLSAANMAKHCTACQLCVSSCPNDVLHPSTNLLRLMQPEMSYEKGYCRPECTKCSEVCPTAAIRPITRADKSSIQTGHAVWIRKNCVPVVNGQTCGNCARHCPTGAIQMIAEKNDEGKTIRIPAVNEERCIGCGACENLCPSRPFPAIYVEGHEVHKTI